MLVHYQRWRHRHDEWFQWDSPLLRPLERVGLRRQGLTAPRSPPVRRPLPGRRRGQVMVPCCLGDRSGVSALLSQVFAAGVKVLACWTDCRFYPAKILSVNGDGEARVRVCARTCVCDS